MLSIEQKLMKTLDETFDEKIREGRSREIRKVEKVEWIGAIKTPIDWKCSNAAVIGRHSCSGYIYCCIFCGPNVSTWSLRTTLTSIKSCFLLFMYCQEHYIKYISINMCHVWLQSFIWWRLFTSLLRWICVSGQLCSVKCNILGIFLNIFMLHRLVHRLLQLIKRWSFLSTPTSSTTFFWMVMSCQL